ncbi:hypothetical protein MNBD_ALPHA01-1335 [hydrothermal vent metagenome]|uniref:Uncharacterized protein n=1 Tax=hydrothermal vent metagenome TaxID=652676 RepID=A0A3B0SVT4_9ZZZZ
MSVLRYKYLFFSIVLVLGPGLILGGCSSVETQPPVYSADVVSRADLLSGRALFGDGARTISLPEDQVMAVDDAMQAYLKRYVPRNYAETTRVKVLARMIFGKGALGMDYEATKTHTARDAFHKAEGNCLAFSYLFAALARERGLKVSFQEVRIPPEWNHMGKEVYYFSRHVNIRIHMKEVNDFIIDINRLITKPHYSSWKISDKSAIALYYSNKGTDFLYDGDYRNAFRYLVKALELSPRDSAIWSNLGVLYRMKEMYNYAEKAYFIALRHDGRQRSVLSNLSVLYDHMGETEKSEYYFLLAKKHQMKNPYYRYFQALEAYGLGDYDLALSHLKEALKRRDNEEKFLNLLGQTYAKLGDESRATEAWEKARSLTY